MVPLATDLFAPEPPAPPVNASARRASRVITDPAFQGREGLGTHLLITTDLDAERIVELLQAAPLPDANPLPGALFARSAHGAH